MSTVKISQLALISQLDANTSNSLFMGVDISSGITGKFTAKTLAQGLYSNDVLNVGTNPVVFPDVAAQFTGEGAAYLQVNLQNTNGDASGDYIVTADNGTDTTNFIDMGINGSTFSDSNYSSMKANDGYVVVQGNEGHPGGNIILGTASSNTQIKFIVGGLTLDNIVGTITNTGAHFPNIDTAISANLATSEAYTDTANTFNKGISATQNTRIDAAFTKANNALANTTGLLNGGLTITGVANLMSNLFIANSTYDYANVAMVRIVGSAGDFYAPPANPGYMLSITGVDGVSSRVVNTTYGTGAYALYTGRKANGTAQTPTAVANNDVIARYSSSGFNGTAFTSTGQGRIDFVADEDFTVANTGSRIEFFNTIPKTNTVTKIATFNATSASFAGVVNPQKGFIYTPTILSGNTSSYTIDIANTSFIKATVNADCTFTLSQYQAGKQVEMWLTNLSNTNRTITHGCTALNSTTNSTTFTIPATSSAHIKWMSFDGDNANTFVKVAHA